ncbi:unnamed protein product [Polarella glacialis]|uniref:Thioredoxin-like fold domain-containing protein n=1 Tax=Polarella glacialis TaxID=89957 RepID=A0A813IAX3_POLGL|nr:unnamed protein product [Polarella glacialis]CAE8647083.1 unnamed protein product [Polarella glacialis]
MDGSEAADLKALEGAEEGGSGSKESESKVKTDLAWAVELLGQELFFHPQTYGTRLHGKRGGTTLSGANLLAAIGSGLHQEKEKSDLECVQAVDVLVPNLKLLLLYFSGRWCPVCSEFDALLRETFTSLKALPESADIELVWISLDVSQDAYTTHLRKLGSTLAVGWSPERIEEVTVRYSVQGIPCLLVLDAQDGKVISPIGREDVERASPNSNYRNSGMAPNQLDRSGPSGLAFHWLELLEGRRAALDDAQMFAQEEAQQADDVNDAGSAFSEDAEEQEARQALVSPLSEVPKEED